MWCKHYEPPKFEYPVAVPGLPDWYKTLEQMREEAFAVAGINPDKP